MLNLTFIDIVGRIIPEALLFFWAFNVLSQTRFELKKNISLSLIMTIFVCLVRSLPIHFGVHTLIILMGYVFINIYMNKMNTIKSIILVIGVIIIEFICEIIDLFMIQYLFGIDTAVLMNDPKLKVLYTFPTFIFFVLIVVGVKVLINKISKKIKLK